MKTDRVLATHDRTDLPELVLRDCSRRSSLSGKDVYNMSVESPATPGSVSRATSSRRAEMA